MVKLLAHVPYITEAAYWSMYVRKGCPLLNDAESNDRSVAIDCDVWCDAPTSFRRFCTQMYRESWSSLGWRDWKLTEATLISEMKLRILCTLSVNVEYCSFGNRPPHGMSYLIKAASLLMPANSMLHFEKIVSLAFASFWPGLPFKFSSASSPPLSRVLTVSLTVE